MILVLISATLLLSSGNSEGKNSPYPTDKQQVTTGNPFSNQAAAPQSSPMHAANTSWIRLARLQLRESQPVRANLKQKIEIGNRKYEVSGTYSEGRAHRLRMSLTMETPHTKGELLQVCDGKVLWTELKRTSAEIAPEGKSKITRCEIGQILQNARISQNPQKANMISSLAMGGMTSLLASLEENIDFTEQKEISLDGKPLKLLEGAWKEEFLTKHGKEKKKQLSRHVPERVRLYLDGETYFPRRIQYLKSSEDQKEGTPLVTLDFTDIVLNAPLTNENFHYTLREGLIYDDITHQYLRELDETR